jgi:hypothetical protein
VGGTDGRQLPSVTFDKADALLNGLSARWKPQKKDVWSDYMSMLVCQVGSSLFLRQTLQKQQTSGETRSATLIAECSLDFRSYLFSPLLRHVCGDAAAARTKPESKSVLLLYAERQFAGDPRDRCWAAEALAARGGVEVFAEHLISRVFRRSSAGLDRFAAQPVWHAWLDMVITTGYEALQFACPNGASFPRCRSLSAGSSGIIRPNATGCDGRRAVL